MRIEELPGDSGGGGGREGGEELPQLRREDCGAVVGKGGVVMRVAVDAKCAAVGVGARMLFYPTLCYNVVRNRLEAHFHWWDQAHGIENLVLPTRDYLYAPSFVNLCEAADFIHRNALSGKLTYVHCKAGRGRSTTVVICYLVQYKNMTPSEAYEHVRLRRPRVLLASAQWQAVQEFYQLRVKKTGRSTCLDNPIIKSPLFLATRNLVAFDDSAFVMVSESDLEGYNADALALNMGSGLWEISLIYRVQFASKAAFAGFSYLWLRCRACKDALPENVGRETCSLEAEQMATGHPCLLQGVVVNP
ncbi:putative dual specificity protein phosphatase DSP8 [Dichanthelium oligosanthes]|uniref:Putative dual specificity protein phosphatase DSP8 n=1 Tax=Dichanthelium oligosanthes TaxID=888268 RepID=A0A1E5VBR3_9POAL|nr:putative dual specificity protein phosphatase DSP8 [Dichanthelium oligosanthes]